MSTDRELLELAAKAAGISGEYTINYNGDYYYQGNAEGILYELPQGGWYVWNPLTDDGDALRLAVKLKIQPVPADDRCEARWWGGPSGITQGSASVITYDDLYAATRRAIVMAAAEIRRAMTEAERAAADVAYNELKNSGELRRQEDERALATQIKEGGNQ